MRFMNCTYEKHLITTSKFCKMIEILQYTQPSAKGPAPQYIDIAITAKSKAQAIYLGSYFCFRFYPQKSVSLAFSSIMGDYFRNSNVPTAS
jgi:hypothetical protein